MTRFFPSRWPWWHNAVRGRVLRISLSFYPVTTRLLRHRLLLSLSFSFLCKLCDFFFKLRIEAVYHVSFTLRCVVTVTLSARRGRILRRWVSLSARRRRSPPWRFALQDVNCKTSPWRFALAAVTSGPTLGLWNGLCRRRHYGRVWNRCWCF